VSAPRPRRPAGSEGGRNAGWYQDPDDPTGVRYWTGRGWTSRRRPRPGWHVIPMDLAADPSWENPGGVDRSLADSRFLDDPEPSDAGAQHPSSRTGETDLPSDEPGLDDSYGDAEIDRPMQAERPARERAFRSEPFAAGSPTAWAAAAGLGGERLRWTPGAAPFGSSARGGQPPGRPLPLMSSGRGGHSAAGWRQTRVPLLVIAGVTIFAVLALLINLGTGARARFSPVTTDATFINQARTTCTTGLAGPAASFQAAGASDVDPARLATVLADLRRLRVTPSAAPQVDGWLSEWQRYIAEEDTLSQDRADHHTAGATTAAAAALTTASQADTFAEDNGIAVCAIQSSSGQGLEQIP
jgi:hypothetical protein